MPSEMEVAPLTEHSFTINRRSDTGFGTWLKNSRSLKSTTTATMVGGPKEFGGTKGMLL